MHPGWGGIPGCDPGFAGSIRSDKASGDSAHRLLSAQGGFDADILLMNCLLDISFAFQICN